MNRIIVVNLLNSELNKYDHIEYDLDEKKFIFGSDEDHYIYDGYLGVNLYDYSDMSYQLIIEQYRMGCSATGNIYIVYDDEPGRLYYIPANNPQPPELVFDADAPDQIREEFISTENHCLDLCELNNR